MRSLMSVLFLVIFCSEQMTSSATFATDVQSDRCVEFSNVMIPVKRVVFYYWTSSNCPRRAIVFKTIFGKAFCVDPETAWVSSHVAKVDKRTTTATEANTTTTATESTATKTTSTESTAASPTATTAKTLSLTI